MSTNHYYGRLLLHHLRESQSKTLSSGALQSRSSSVKILLLFKYILFLRLNQVSVFSYIKVITGSYLLVQLTSHHLVPKYQSQILVFHRSHLVWKAQTDQNDLTQIVIIIVIILLLILIIITSCSTPSDRVFRNAGLVILRARVLQPHSAHILFSLPISFTCFSVYEFYLVYHPRT